MFAMHSGHAQDTVCARVKIEIKQKLTLERQAFDAEMKINNTTDTGVVAPRWRGKDYYDKLPKPQKNQAMNDFKGFTNKFDQQHGTPSSHIRYHQQHDCK